MLQLALTIIIFLIIVIPVGRYMYHIATWNHTLADPVFDRLDGVIYKIGGVNPHQGMNWRQYALALVGTNAVMVAIGYLILRIQSVGIFNPNSIGNMEPTLAFNTIISFMTNTNLQHYSGESGLSYLSQMLVIIFMMFVSAASGYAACIAFIRGLTGKTKDDVGNFFADLTRITTRLLLPFSIVGGLLLVWQGVPQNFDANIVVNTLEGTFQTIAMGPIAALEIIKHLGTNGGGFFGPNSTHPFENASFFTNFIETMSIIVIPMACVWMFGRLTGRMKHAAVIFAVMLSLLCVKLGCAVYFESAPSAAFHGLDIENSSNLEGKELRYGTSGGPAWSIITTATSNGSVNAMHDSLNPLAGLMPMIGMWLNVVFGGVGVGFINMFLYIIVGVFISGMMVGRTPEYLGRKVETREMKLALLAILAHPFFILGGTALFAATSWGADTVANAGFHGFSEILYEFTSSAANNGSGFEGLGDNTVPWNIATGLVMLLARYIPIILPLAMVGSLAAKTPAPETAGTLRTDTLLFGGVLLGCVLIVGALLFMPVAVLGPIADHLSVMR